MKKSAIASIFIFGLMLSAAVAAKLLTPTIYLSKSKAPLELDVLIPEKFGNWREEKNMAGSVVNPEAQAMLQKIYTQTLSRTYVNEMGARVMLSIAYGSDQRDGMQVHYPEVCYPAQGFQLDGMREDTLTTQYGNIPVKRLLTSMAGQRYEPVTYWTTVGNKAVAGSMAKKMAEISYAVHGEIPDGLLFRVSLIDRDAQHSFSVQDRFIRDLLQAMPFSARQRIAGLSGS